MDERKQWLEDAIFDYVSSNKNIDSVDIVQHFKLRADITMGSVGMLQKDNRIKRVWLWGFRYTYIAYGCVRVC